MIFLAGIWEKSKNSAFNGSQNQPSIIYVIACNNLLKSWSELVALDMVTTFFKLLNMLTEVEQVCFKVNKTAPLTRICGSFTISKNPKVSILQTNNAHTFRQYHHQWSIHLIKRHVLELNIRQFMMLSTPECSVVYLEITRQLSSPDDTITHWNTNDTSRIQQIK